MKGYEIAYSEDEDNMSVYSAWSEKDSSSVDSDLDSEEEECECRPICLLQVVNWEENTAKSPISSSYRMNPGTFICDHCQCHEADGLPMYCEESGNIYHRECFIAEARRKTKDGSINNLVEQEYEEYFYETEQWNEIKKRDLERMKFDPTMLDPFKKKEESSSSTEEDSSEEICYKEELNPCTEQLTSTENICQAKTVSTSKYSNYMEIGLKYPQYKKYHLHAYVDNGSGFSLASKFAIPEEFWKKDRKNGARGRTVEGRLISMDTVARKVNISIGGGNFLVEEIWQSEGQEFDVLLENNFLLQHTFIQKTPENILGFAKGDKIFWTERLRHAKSVVGPSFTNQYQRTQQNCGDCQYKPKFEEILLYKWAGKDYEQQEELLIEESSEEENESSGVENDTEGEEAEFIQEHNLKIFQNKLQRQKEKMKKHMLGEIKQMLKKNTLTL